MYLGLDNSVLTQVVAQGCGLPSLDNQISKDLLQEEGMHVYNVYVCVCRCICNPEYEAALKQRCKSMNPSTELCETLNRVQKYTKALKLSRTLNRVGNLKRSSEIH